MLGNNQGEDKIMGHFYETWCNPEISRDIALETFNKFSKKVEADSVDVDASDERYIQFTFIKDSNKICGFRLNEFPRAGTVAISGETWVNYDLRNKGIGKALQRVKEKIAKLNNIYLLVATVSEHNKPERHLLKKFGWKKLLLYPSYSKTYNCFLYSKRIS